MNKIFMAMLPVMASTQLVNLTDSNNVINKSLDDLIILDDMSLKDVKVNVYNLDQEGNFNKNRLFQLFLSEAKKTNNDMIDNLNAIFKDFLINQDDWYFLDFPSSYPQIDTTIFSNINVFYVGTGNFEGSLSFTVEIANKSEIVKDLLADQFEKNELGILMNPKSEQNMIDLIFKYNPKAQVTSDDFLIKEISYYQITLEAKESSKYTGFVKFNYTTKFSLDWTGNSGTLRVNAYNSEQTKYWKQKFVFKSFLGKNKFLDLPNNKIAFSISGYTWDNKNDWNYFENIKTQEKELIIEETVITNYPISMNIDSGTNRIYHREYVNINKMKSDLSVNYEWINNFEFEIEFHLNVFAYATAINAYWARTESNVRIFDFIII
ncbi:hypothetical protein [Spiroplasma culicicola]|uniref:Uncharacterized protein n=1 Tax=Spiroplasma culicicola AES-1 TaxID=1276246 RepID=W6A7U1_9MOLU|nr:hypothetical protein [Spiroplasma culicicola]AHI52945.1 hypothetical protein SCULI_v1c06040 [Spiroplasma culicicola AES-1]